MYRAQAPLALANRSCECARGGEAARPLLTPAPWSPPAIPGGNLLSADLNADGRSDLLIVAGGRLHVLLGDGNAFREAPGSPIDVPRDTGELALGDLNGDGDLAVLLGDGTGVAVLLGR